MECSIEGIAKSVVSGNKEETLKNVKNISKTSALDKAKAGDTPDAFITRLVQKLNLRYEGKKVHVLDISSDKDKNYTLKYKVGQSPKVLTTTVGETSPFVSENGKYRLDAQTLREFNSDHEYIRNIDDYDIHALDITNNPEKIIQLGEDLISMDDTRNDNEHNLVLRQQLRQIAGALGKIVPELAVHINSRSFANFGTLSPAENAVFIDKGPGGSKSLMEIYTHELYHAVTHFAISSADIDIRNTTARMERIRDNFLSNTEAKDLVQMSGDQLSLKEANALLDHMTDPEVGLHEFVALSMTNKATMNQLKSLDIKTKETDPNASLFYKLLALVQKLFDRVSATLSKEPTSNDLARMVFLVNSLHTANKKPLRAKKADALRNVISIVSPLEERWAAFLNKKMAEDKDNLSRNVAKPGESNLTYFPKLVARSFYDQQARDIITGFLSVATIKGNWNPFQPEASLPTIIKDMFESDQLQDLVESLGMISQVLDQQREFTATAVSKTVLESFDRELTEEEEIALTSTILDTDLSTVFFEYDVVKLLEEKGALGGLINELNNKLKEQVDPASYNFYKAQMDLLSGYLVDNTDNIALLKNASNIAKKVGTPLEDFSVSDEVTSLIDQITTLKALRRTSNKDKAILLDLLKNESNGVGTIVAHQEGQKASAEETLFPTPSDKLKIIKGYSAQITDPDIDLTIAPVSQKNALKAQGYVLKTTLKKHKLDKNDSPMAVYVSHRFVQQRFHRVGMRMTDKGRRGTSITESYAKGDNNNHTLRAVADIQNLKMRKDQVVKLMSEGNYKVDETSDDSLVSPILNNTGQVKDFAYGMDKELKIELLEMDRAVSTVLGRTAASTFDKKSTETFNKKLMEVIKEDAKENVVPGQISPISSVNSKVYIKIEKDSSNPEVRDLWKILPADVKAEFKDGFTIRRDLMHSYLGFRELSIIDLPGVSALFSRNPTKAVEVIRYSVQFAEKLWKELVKISKVDIIIRTPGVFIGNVVSNFVLMYMSGYSFKEITKLKLQGARELKNYVDGLKESLALEAKSNAGVITLTEQRRLDVIKNNLLNSPVKDLVDQGFYTTIIEEIEHSSDTGSYFNKAAKRKLKDVPKIFSDGIDMLYITERTQLFKLMEKGIQASDFAARYAQYHLMIKDGVSKEKAVKTVRDNFIDYNKPNGRFVEWANQMGFVMFTKYFTRIQRVLRDYGKNHPAKLALAILAQDFVIGEVEDVTDQSIFTKDMGNLFYNPVDNLMRVITPTSAEAVDWALNGY